MEKSPRFRCNRKEQKRNNENTNRRHRNQHPSQVKSKHHSHYFSVSFTSNTVIPLLGYIKKNWYICTTILSPTSPSPYHIHIISISISISINPPRLTAHLLYTRPDYDIKRYGLQRLRTIWICIWISRTLKNIMSRNYQNLQPHARDSLELASLASSSPGPRTSTSSTSSRSGISSSRKLSLEEDDPLDARNPAASGRPNRRGRTISISSAFDFSSNLFPLSSTAGNGYAPIGAPISASDGQNGFLGGGSLEKHKTLTYLNGLSLIVGIIIGSGIFSSPSQVNSNAGSPGAALIVWAIAGVLAWTGASSYAELGGAIPLNGGAQVYLAKIFGELFGFLFTWCAVMVLKPGGAAIISIIMGEYLVRAAIGAEAENVSSWINKSVALAGLLVVTLLNCISTKLGTKMGDMFMFMKFIALLAITVTGIVVAITGYSSSGPANQDWKTKGWFEGTSHSASSWAVAVYAGLWAFDGWDNVSVPRCTSDFC